MFQELFLDHIRPRNIRFPREFIPELEVLIELGPALGNSGRDQAEEIVQEPHYQLILGPLIFREQAQLLVRYVVAEGVSQEVGYVCPHVYFRVLNE
jgi:hypothetical protein